jgi:hypothetical protein
MFNCWKANDAAHHGHDEQRHHEEAAVDGESDEAIHRDRSFSESL